MSPPSISATVLQKLLNQLFSTTEHATINDVDKAATQIIRQNEEAFKDTLFQLFLLLLPFTGSHAGDLLEDAEEGAVVGEA